MSEPKYNLSQPTQEETDGFMKEFQELLNKHSMFFEPIPQWQRKTYESPWEIACTIFLQKKTLAEAESIKSPLSDEMLNNG